MDAAFIVLKFHLCSSKISVNYVDLLVVSQRGPLQCYLILQLQILSCWFFLGDLKVNRGCLDTDDDEEASLQKYHGCQTLDRVFRK